MIDNEIIGVALRTMAGFDVSEDTLSVDIIRSVCNDGPGHFLGHSDTLQRMKTGFFYPKVSDRNSIKDWLDNNAVTMLDNAAQIAKQILAEHMPNHIDHSVDESVRQKINIALPTACVHGSQVATSSIQN